MSMWPVMHLAGDFVVKAGFQFGPRSIDDYELVYFPHSSSGTYIAEGKVFKLEQPCVTLTSRGVEHHYIFNSHRPTRHLFVHFELGGKLSNEVREELFNNCIPLHGSSFVIHSLHELMVAAYKKEMFWQERCSALLMVILTELLKPAGNDTNQTEPIEIVHAKRFIAEKLDQALTVNQVASAVGWSHEHLTRSFRRYVGVNPQIYIMIQRIEFACRLLLSSTEAVKQIAYKVGFSDEHYFARCFNKIKGITPTAYRKSFVDTRSYHVEAVLDGQADYPLNQYFLVEGK